MNKQRHRGRLVVILGAAALCTVAAGLHVHAAGSPPKVSRFDLVNGDLSLVLLRGTVNGLDTEVRKANLEVRNLSQPSVITCGSKHPEPIWVGEYMKDDKNNFKFTDLSMSITPTEGKLQFVVVPDPAGDYTYEFYENEELFDFGACEIEPI